MILCFIGLLSVKSPRYRQRLAERYGFYGNTSCPPQGIFIHAASVGEVIAATPLVRQLQQDYRIYPLLLQLLLPQVQNA